MDSFGKKLAAARKRRGWKQPDLAATSGVDQGAISRYERGLAEPLLSKAISLAKAVGIPPQELFGESAANQVVLREPPAVDPWLAWAKQLRAAYERNPDVVISGIRTAWPKPTAEKILVWLNTNSKR